MCSSTVRLKSELCAKRCRAWDVRAWPASQVATGHPCQPCCFHVRLLDSEGMLDVSRERNWGMQGARPSSCLDALHHGLVQRLASGAIPGAATQEWVLQSLFSAGTLQPVCAGGGVGKGVW